MTAKVCTKCKIEKLLVEFFIRSDRPLGRSSECKTCNIERSIKYSQCEKARAWQREYRKTDKAKAIHKKSRQTLIGMEKERIRARKRYWRDPEYERMKARARKYNCSIDLLDEILYRDCMCLVCWTRDNLTFDHIIPTSKGGKAEYNNLQILCHSCNASKGAR